MGAENVSQPCVPRRPRSVVLVGSTLLRIGRSHHAIIPRLRVLVRWTGMSGQRQADKRTSRPGGVTEAFTEAHLGQASASTPYYGSWWYAYVDVCMCENEREREREWAAVLNQSQCRVQGQYAVCRTWVPPGATMPVMGLGPGPRCGLVEAFVEAAETGADARATAACPPPRPPPAGAAVPE